MEQRWQVPGYVLGGEVSRDEFGIVLAGVSLGRGAAVRVHVIEGPPPSDLVLAQLARLTELTLDGVLSPLEVLSATRADDKSRSVAVVSRDLEATPLIELVADQDLTAGEVVGTFAPIADSLARLHAAGYAHGAICAAAIWVDAAGLPWLTGLGAALASGRPCSEEGDVDDLVEVIDGISTSPLDIAGPPADGAGGLAAALAARLTGLAPPQALRARRHPEAGFDFAARLRAAAAEPVTGGSGPSERRAGLSLGRGRWATPRGWLPQFAPRHRRPRGRLLARAATVVVLLVGGWVALTVDIPTSTPSSGVQAGTPTRTSPAQLAQGAVTGPRDGTTAPALSGSPTASRPDADPSGGSTASRPSGGSTASPPSGATAASRPSASPSRSATAPTVEHRTPPPDAPPLVDPLISDRAAPATNPAGLVQALADLRATGWAARDLDQIDRLDAPGSLALSADRRALSQAIRSGLRYRDLRFTVTQAVSVPGSGDVNEAVINAVIDTSPYAVHPPSGPPTKVAAAPDRQVTLALTWSGTVWQVARVVTDAAASAG